MGFWFVTAEGIYQCRRVVFQSGTGELSTSCLFPTLPYPEVPSSLHSQLIHWPHFSLPSCNPGIVWTMFVIKQRFWWPFMDTEMGEYVAACPVFAWTKVSHLLLLVFCAQYLFLINTGLTFSWILLLVCLSPKVMPPYLLCTDSLTWCTLLLYAEETAEVVLLRVLFTWLSQRC